MNNTIRPIDHQQQRSLPPVASLFHQDRHGQQQHHPDAQRNVHRCHLGRHRDAADGGRNADDQQQVQQVGADDVAQGYILISLDQGIDGGYQLRQGGAQGNEVTAMTRSGTWSA